MLERWYPTAHVPSVFAIDYEKLAALGYSNLYDLGGILSWPYEIEGDFEGHF